MLLENCNLLLETCNLKLSTWNFLLETCYVILNTWEMLLKISYMKLVAWNLLNETWCMKLVIWNLLHKTCWLKLVTCYYLEIVIFRSCSVSHNFSYQSLIILGNSKFVHKKLVYTVVRWFAYVNINRHTLLEMTFFAGIPVFLENDLKPFVEGYISRVYNPSIEGMEPIYRGN